MKKILVVSIKYIIYDVIIMEEVVDFKNAGQLNFKIIPLKDLRHEDNEYNVLSINI